MPIKVNTMEEAARLYRKVEAAIDKKTEEFAAAVAAEKNALQQLEVIMRAMLNREGVGTMNIPGVAEVAIKPKRVFGCADWDNFMHYLVQNDCPELLQRRIHEANMQAWIDDMEARKKADPDFQYQLPPGVNVHTENILKVLKPK